LLKNSPGLLDQCDQEVERSAPEPNRLLAFEERAPASNEPKRAKCHGPLSQLAALTFDA
jgi:hypothetical protein